VLSTDRSHMIPMLCKLRVMYATISVITSDSSCHAECCETEKAILTKEKKVDRKPFRILAIAGSLRQGSYNRGLLRAAQEVAPGWVEVQFFDIGQLPFFNEDVEAAGDPEPVRRLKGAIATSNAVLIATPEYNGVVPGVLVNAIDWASRPTGRSVLSNKLVAIMGAVLGKSGSVNAQAALRGVLGRIGAIVVPDPQVLVPRASRLFDEHVDLRDEGTREEIRQLVEAVAYWCRRVQPEELVGAQSVTGS
jgi:chromate reductase, NAD(P)H dehydrogenase (quinone)